MAFSVVGMSYASADYNIGINMSCKKDIDIEKFSKLLSGIEGAEDYLVGAGYDFDVSKPEYTKEYGEYCRQLYDDSEDVSQMFLITVLDDKSYDKYASDADIKNAAAGAILVNKCTFDVYNENSSKYVKKEMELYKYKAGDTIECGYNVYDDASSDDNAVEGGTESSTEDNSGYVDEETINNGVRKTVDVTIAGVTDKVPIGYKGYSNTLLFMNQKGFESLWGDGKNGNEIKPGYASYSAYVVAENADEYQDTFEKETEGNPEYSQISFYVSNLDKEMRDEKSLFTLLGVFAYGLIVVIALIGITNIINTLSTGMELRSREFATLRSIGMTDKQFVGMVRLESVFISVKALVIGVPLGILISYLLCVMMNRMDDAIIYEPPYKAIILCIVVVIMLIYAIMKLSMTKLRHNNIMCDTFTEPEYELLTAGNLKEAGVLLSEHPGLVLLDVSLPDGNGFDFYSERLEKEKTPVIFLTARDEENDIVKGLELGAEDYITKPFSVRELVATVNRVFLRRKSDDSSSVIHAGSISYDLDKKEARRAGQVIALSSLENRILDLLFTNHDKAVSRNAVIDCIWEATGNDVYDHTVTVYMKRIRAKLGEDVIKTVKGIGYRVDSDEAL